jgi:hypothetical protein
VGNWGELLPPPTSICYIIIHLPPDLRVCTYVCITNSSVFAAFRFEWYCGKALGAISTSCM